MIECVHDENYKAWVRKQPCCVRDTNCQGPIEAHHTGRAYFGTKGNARAGDDTCVPICSWHHHLVQYFPWRFKERYQFLPDEGYARTKYYARYCAEVNEAAGS